MQHRIFNQSFVAQVVSQGLLNVQFMVSVEAQKEKGFFLKKQKKTEFTVLNLYSCYRSGLLFERMQWTESIAHRCTKLLLKAS